MFTPEKVKMKVGISGTLVFKDAAGNVIGSTEILDPALPVQKIPQPEAPIEGKPSTPQENRHGTDL